MQSILPALRALLFALALLPLIMLGGCGLKGDLVLADPDAPSSSQLDSGEDAVDSASDDDDDSQAPGASLE